MKRTMYEAARHTPKDEAGGSNPFKRAIGLSLDAIRAPGPAFYFAVSPAFVAGVFVAVFIVDILLITLPVSTRDKFWDIF